MFTILENATTIESARSINQSNTLMFYNLNNKKLEEIAKNVININSAPTNRHWISYTNTEGEIRIIKNHTREENDTDNRIEKQKWVNLSRIDLSIKSSQEWTQIFQEAWRLQKDFFWSKNMSDINWKEIKKRYLPLLKRIGSRLELTDILWEMQGELGTSHTYVIGGDFKQNNNKVYQQGLLGAELYYDNNNKAYCIYLIFREDNVFGLLTKGDDSSC